MTALVEVQPGTAERLAELLPERDGRTSAERLQAIAWRAVNDGTPRLEARLHARLSVEECEDAHSVLVIVGLRCVATYEPGRDRGTDGDLPLDRLFGRFAYLRVRLRLVDSERRQFGDRRPGRSVHPEILELVPGKKRETIRKSVSGTVTVKLAAPGTEGSASGCAAAPRALVAAILAKPSDYFITVQTSDFPNGAVRGRF